MRSGNYPSITLRLVTRTRADGLLAARQTEAPSPSGPEEIAYRRGLLDDVGF
jgi:hypothetical protein